MPKNDSIRDPRKGDDRNLVLIDQDFGQPDLEDRMWLFWVRNKTVILGLGVVLILGALGYIGWHAWSDHRLAALQAEYQALGDKPEDKLAFARANAGQPLAGIAALEVADQYFKDKKYPEAAGAYALARANFPLADKTSAAFAGRALLGEAFSKLNGTDPTGGAAALTTLARTPAYPDAERAHALYTLALLAVEKKDFAAARGWLDAMDRDVDPNNPWAMHKRQLIAYEPALAKPLSPDLPAATPPAAATPDTPAP